MPYKTNDDLPAGVKNLPDDAKSTWRKIYNNAYKTYDGDEKKCASVAWAGLKGAGWEKDESGTWTKVAKSFEIFVPVSKLDDEQNIVLGWGSVTKVNGQPVIDCQGDVIEDLELEKAVYDFMAAPKHDEMHKRIVPDSVIVESFICTDEKLAKMFGDEAPQGGFRGWWLGIKVNDPEIYAKHKSGEYTGFSITGTARREEV